MSPYIPNPDSVVTWFATPVYVRSPSTGAMATDAPACKCRSGGSEWASVNGRWVCVHCGRLA